MRLTRLLILSLTVAASALAQHDMTSHDAATPVTIEPGLGNVHWPVSTKNAEAQRFFDQGMKYLYGFNHESAVRSFQRATQLDPDLAMGYWGTALALGPNINLDVDPEREKQAYDSVLAALAHEAHASAKERGLFAALARRYSNDPKADLKKLAVDYSAAMGAVMKKYPDDLDIATLYAESLMDLHPWKFWSHDGRPNEGTTEIVSVLESVLRRNPNHLGANHYYVHAMEASPHPERALASAERLKTMAPMSGHLVHMPAHIYERTGNYAGAALANTKAAETDRVFMKNHGAEGIYAAMYYNHNLQFGLASYAMIGRFAEAKTMADEFAANATAMAKEMPPAEAAASSTLLVLVRYGRWGDILREKPVDVGPLSSAFSHFARGSAFAKLGDVAGAESEQRAFEAARTTVPDDPGFYQNSERAIAEVAVHVLAGRIAEARGDSRQAIAEYTEAVEKEDALDYDEPADWFYPTRETLGAALLRAGRYAEAEKAFRADLTRNKHNPRSLFGLAAALRAQKKDAAPVTAEFGRVWEGGKLGLADY
ncbi:MAG TPA: bacterial transcriptional activator domain-containing protein [Thermoanaerobaculia bacterium]|nr:bacterial transcriptional activator domain-containing protein [Thermoanaerobaculia bacterium]